MEIFRFLDLLAYRDHFSPSFLNDMFSCSMRAVLRGILRLDATRKSKSPALLKGSILHKAMEYYFLKLKNRDLSGNSTDILTDCFERALEYYEGLRDSFEPAMLDSAIKYFRGNTQLIQVLAEFLDMNFKNRVLTSDARIQVELSFPNTHMYGFCFNGRIDLWFDNELIDFKTVGQGHNDKDKIKFAQEVSKLRREFAMQLLIYKEGLPNVKIPEGEMPPPIPDTFKIIEVVLTKNPVVNQYTFTKEEIESAANELRERALLAKEMLRKKQIFRNYRTTGCPCEYSEYCLDEDNLKMVLSKTNTPKDFF